ncbi:MAG: acyl--CoA ligase, partial [Gammaproteobacteria bacterium]|nr:acyl--CoA ligase [Gammaproteobacteria bacterium]
MYAELQVGTLHEPLNNRSWQAHEIMQRVRSRSAWYSSNGLKRHDRVFLHYGNSLEFFVDLLAIWNQGACAIPVDERLTAYEISKLAGVTHPSFSIWDATPDEDTLRILTALDVTIADIPGTETSPDNQASAGHSYLDDEALILFTSGTTGDPKAVVHTHRSLRARWISLRQKLGLDAYKRSLCLLPTHFGHGLICNCLFPWLMGQDLYILPPYRSDILMQLGEIIDRHQVTFMSSVPPVWRIAVKTASPPKAASLTRIFCGSAPLSGTLKESIQAWSGTNNVFNAYGITETASWLAGSTDSSLPAEDGFIGKPWGGVLKVLKSGDTNIPPWESQACKPDESGYVWINTPALMRGYLGQDDLTSHVVSHGWFVTGDIGIVDERGYLYLRGREREEINKGGTKIYPADIDAVAERFENVTDVCAFAFKDPLLGENIGIALVMSASAD